MSILITIGIFYLLFSYILSLSVVSQWIKDENAIPIKGCVGKVLVITLMPLLLIYFAAVTYSKGFPHIHI